MVSSTMTHTLNIRSNPLRVKLAYAFAVVLGLIVLPGSAGAGGLLEIYELAKEYDAELKAAEFEYEAATESVNLSRSTMRPSVDLFGNYAIRDQTNDRDGSYDRQTLGLTARQTIFNFASMIEIDQSKLAVRQARAQLEAQRQNLMLRVSTAYFDVLRAQATLLFRRSELDAIGRQKEQNERRFEVGLVPVTDVKDAQAQFDLASAQEIAAANQLSTTQEALIVISGADPSRLEELQDDAPLVAPKPSNIDAWVNLSKEQNIPLVISRLAAESAQESVRGVRATRYPSLDLVFNGTANDSGYALGGGSSNSSELRLELNVPLLTGGRISAQSRQAKMQAQAAAQQLSAQTRATVQSTRDSYRSVIADISRVNALRQALISTQKSLEAQEAGFAEGLLTSLEVLRSLRDTFRAQSDYSSARYDYIINSLNLKLAAGILQENDLQQIDSWLVKAE